jgi:hypothetical protein
MTPLEYFRVLAPEFAAVPDASVNVWLQMALDEINVECLDVERAARAQALYAAHLLKTSSSAATGSGGMGQVTSEKEGDLQRTYATLSNSTTWIGSTPYGQMYLEITRVCGGVGILTRFS